MTLLRKYGVSNDMTLDQLQEWIGQIEDIAVSEITAIKANKASKMTLVIVDLDRPKPPKKAKITLVQPAGAAAIKGQAFVSAEAKDVFISR